MSRKRKDIGKESPTQSDRLQREGTQVNFIPIALELNTEGKILDELQKASPSRGRRFIMSDPKCTPKMALRRRYREDDFAMLMPSSEP